MDVFVVVAALLMLIAILSTRFTQRFGLPALVLFVGIGVLAGSGGPLGIDFSDYGLSLNVGMLALAIILFSGGLDTRERLFRASIVPAALLATFGVVLKMVIVGLAAWWFTPLDLMSGMLLGAVLAPTDAAAVFGVLKGRGLPARLRGVLEAESGTNDPVAIYLTIALSTAIGVGSVDGWGLVGGVVLQLTIGAVLGVLFGRALVWLINNVSIDAFGLYPILALAGAMLAFSASNLLYGNGFLSVYVVGLMLGNAHLVHRHTIASFMDGVAWGAQISMFLLLGLLVFPSQIPDVIGGALLITVVLTFVARPLAVFATFWLLRRATRRYRFSVRESTLVSWAGLKGAVPIILAIVPLLQGVPQAQTIFNMVFVVVVVGTLIQGWTVGPLAKWLRLSRSEPPRPPLRLELGGAAPAGAAVYDVYLEASRRVVGQRLRDLALPDGVVVAAILRGERLVTPKGDTVFEAGDHVYFISSDDGITGIPPAFTGSRVGFDRLEASARERERASVEAPTETEGAGESRD
ncbi:MAG: potassium/proton antiporter [Trueperaceae bacterium]|nr:potassium/proton antiporter [Trueperaceae bacterium]